MTSEALTTKARVKERLQITATNFDDVIDRLILAASRRVQQMTSRNFLLATYTSELYDGSDVDGARRTMLVLKNAPVSVLTSIQYKSGSNSSPVWTSYDENDYDFDTDLGVAYFKVPLPRGKRNIRVTYTAGYNGYSIGLQNVWTFNVTPTGTVDGVNRTFTLPANATSIIVYADGVRISPSNYDFTSGDDEFTFDASYQPYSTISADYSEAGEESEDNTLPDDLIEAVEEIVVRVFKRRDSEGRTSESFQESSITWSENVITKENRATILNYRRASFI